MLMKSLTSTKNKLHQLVSTYQNDSVTPDDIKTYLSFQLINKLAHGQCHSLTLALHDFTGLPITMLVDNSGKPMHSYVTHDGCSLDGYLITDEHITIKFYEKVGNHNGLTGAIPTAVTRNQLVNHFQFSFIPQREILAYFDALLNTVNIDYSTFINFNSQNL